LPADLPAAVFVVVHLGEGSPGMLPRILDRAGPLEAAQLGDGDSVENGRVYVAPLSYTAPAPAEWEPSSFSTRARA
jgi:two-component system chemotaxis response regulator CheB